MKLLTDYMTNNGKLPEGRTWGWGAGSQLEALRFYTSDLVEILAEYQDNDYQGSCYALMLVGDTVVLWRDSFGSCSGCDGLEGSDGYEYIKATLAEGNTRQFDSFLAAGEYLESPEDYWWRSVPSEIKDAIQKHAVPADDN